MMIASNINKGFIPGLRAGLDGGLKRWYAASAAPSDAHLHYEEMLFPPKVGASSEPPRVAVIVHGLLGSGRNWRSFTRSLGAAVSCSKEAEADGRGWRFLLVDQRNHGLSTLRNHAAPHTIQASASDLNTLLDGKAPDVLMGHSMGGKVALEYIRLMHSLDLDLPRQTWVMDSMPGTVGGDPHNAKETLETLRKLPQPVPSRKWLGEYMQGKGFPKLVTDWVGTNLVEMPGSKPGIGPLVWAFNVEGCAEMYASYADNCMWKVLEAPPRDIHIDVVRAEKSLPWPQEIEDRLSMVGASGFNVGIHTLDKSGHWIQMDNPSGLCNMLAPTFSRSYTKINKRHA